MRQKKMVVTASVSPLAAPGGTRGEPRRLPCSEHITGGQHRSRVALERVLTLSERLDNATIGLEEAERELTRALSDPNKGVRWNAILVIAKYASTMTNGLVAAIESSDIPVRTMGIGMLARSLSEDKVWWGHGDYPEARAARMAKALLERLNDGFRPVRQEAMTALYHLAMQRPIELLDAMDAYACERGLRGAEELSGTLCLLHAVTVSGIIQSGKARQA